MSANDIQIGGLHYKTSYQHWDFIERHGIGYIEGCDSKYVTRWKKKNGVEDVEKSVHYTQKLLELNVEINRQPRGFASESEIVAFCDANELGDLEMAILLELCGNWTPFRLQNALRMQKELLQQAKAFHKAQASAAT